jgi:prepilin-type N-terminal cleavage/methylation domain-containing protein
MNKQKSFTLIELLVVIVIIGILAGVIMISTSSSIDKANITKLKVFEESVQNNLAVNMVSRWPLDEKVSFSSSYITPDAWGDSVGLFGDGVTSSTYPNIEMESNCISEKCFKFDGNNYIDCGNDIGVLASLTISTWVKSSIWSANIFNNHYHTHGGENILLHFNGAGFYLQADDGTVSGYLAWDNTLSVNTWYNLVGTWNGNVMKLYINGIAQSSTLSFSGGVNHLLNGGLNIGRYFNTGQPGFQGLIDDVRLYDAALSSSQIKQNYIAGLNSMLANGNISKEDYNERINQLAYNDNNE